MSKYSIEKYFLNEEYPFHKKEQQKYVAKLIQELGLRTQIKKVVNQFEEVLSPKSNLGKVIREYLPFHIAVRVKDAVEAARNMELLQFGLSKYDLPKIAKATDEELKNIIYAYNERSWSNFYSNLSNSEKLSYKEALIKRIYQQTEIDLNKVRSLIAKYKSKEVIKKHFEEQTWLSTFLEEAAREFVATGKRKKEAHTLKDTDESKKVYLDIMRLQKYLPSRPWTQEKLLNYFENNGGKIITLNTFKAWKQRNKARPKIKAVIDNFSKDDFNNLIGKLGINPCKLSN